MTIAQIEENLQKLIKSIDRETFIYDLLLAYGSPKASVTRLKKGNLNMSKVSGEVSWKKKLTFKEVKKGNLHLILSELKDNLKHDQRFVVATDYKTFLAIDTKTGDTLDIKLKKLPEHYTFFLPWAGMEKARHLNENPADVKAAEKMAKLFDEIKKDNRARRSRRAMIDSGELNWAAINPDIFGSMIQAVVDPTQRGGLGMHYTSVPNIMKVIEPLFLNDLNEEYEKAGSSKKKLGALLALWLAEHQMNQEFLKVFGETSPTLPLKEAGNIVCGNACRIAWEEVCPKEEGDEIYVLQSLPGLSFRFGLYSSRLCPSGL